MNLVQISNKLTSMECSSIQVEHNCLLMKIDSINGTHVCRRECSGCEWELILQRNALYLMTGLVGEMLKGFPVLLSVLF